jgi:hypothetical protein
MTGMISILAPSSVHIILANSSLSNKLRSHQSNFKLAEYESNVLVLRQVDRFLGFCRRQVEMLLVHTILANSSLLD